MWMLNGVSIKEEQTAHFYWEENCLVSSDAYYLNKVIRTEIH